MEQPIYLDYNATTPLDPAVLEAMLPYFHERFGNPSSAHSLGRKARQALEEARDRIASLLGARSDEVLFTSGATEANNLALFGLVGASPGHILGSPIEHPCIVEPLKQLADRGCDVEWLPVESNGSVGVDAIGERLRLQTRIVALMLVNHETGAIQPVREAAARAPNVYFHTDAAQAVGKLPVSFRDLNVASLSASGHKFGAMKGIGLLLVKRGTKLQPLFFGGHQQQGRRPGTEPVALAVGLATALEISCRRMSEAHVHISRLRDRLLQRLREGASPLVVNSPKTGSPYVLNVSFPGCRAELLLMKLDVMGIACSTGSACSSGSLLPSPVLRAMGVPDDVLRSAMRFSFGASLTEKEIDSAARAIVKCAIESRDCGDL